METDILTPSLDEYSRPRAQNTRNISLKQTSTSHRDRSRTAQATFRSQDPTAASPYTCTISIEGLKPAAIASVRSFVLSEGSAASPATTARYCLLWSRVARLMQPAYFVENMQLIPVVPVRATRNTISKQTPALHIFEVVLQPKGWNDLSENYKICPVQMKKPA